VKAMDNEREGFANLRQKFPRVSKAMKKEGIFFGSQIEELFEGIWKTLHSHLNLFLDLWEPFPMNLAEGSIRIFSKMKRGSVENAVQICWLTTAGVF
jgi:hypothetical protein